jgi:hypothetical protein
MIEAMKQALGALEMLLTLDTHDEMHLLETDIAPKAITALRQSIEQVEKHEPVAKVIPGTCKASEPPKQEPVAYSFMRCRLDGALTRRFIWLDDYKTSPRDLAFVLEGEDAVALYAAPPKPEWIGLTDEEIDVIQELPLSQNDYLTHYAYAIAAKLKEKNHG